MIFNWIIASRSSYGLNCRLCFTEETVFAALGVSTEHNSTDEKTVQYLLLDLGYTN